MKQKGQAAIIIIILLAVVVGYLFLSGTVNFANGNISFNQENLLNPNIKFSMSSCGSPESAVKSFFDGLNNCEYTKATKCVLGYSKYSEFVSKNSLEDVKTFFEVMCNGFEPMGRGENVTLCEPITRSEFVGSTLGEKYSNVILENYSQITIDGFVDVPISFQGNCENIDLTYSVLKVEGKWLVD